MSRHTLSDEVDRHPRTPLRRKHQRSCSAAVGPNNRGPIPKNRAQYLFSIWVRLMMFSFAVHVFHVLSLKCTVFVEVPRRELLRVPHRLLCTLRASRNYVLVRLDRLMTLGKELSVRGPHLYFEEPWGRWKRETGTATFSSRQEHQFNSTGSSRHQWKSAGFVFPGLKYFRSLKWTPIPLSVGFALLAYQHYKRIIRRNQHGSQSVILEENISQDWEITCYRMMPWKSLSKAWGWVNNVYLPVFSREFLINLYVKAFNCDISEAVHPDLSSYSNLGEFFRRPLKTGLRPVDKVSPLVSPADGTVLHYGSVDCGKIEQVKGVTYSLPAFLGPQTWDTPGSNDGSLVYTNNIEVKNNVKANDEEFCSRILKQKIGTVLQYCVIYLAPGDYHHFHSPADWDIDFRRHFGGELLSVNPKIAQWIAGLFSLNERAVYVGKWQHGFFSMTAVGATNVGSILVYGDQDLQTNTRRVKKNTYQDKWFEKKIHCEKGEDIGEFNLGSTIVLLFEAPPSFQFNLEPGQKVKVGQSLGKKPEESAKMRTDNLQNNRTETTTSSLVN